MRTLAAYSHSIDRIRTKALRSLVENDERIVGFTIEPDGVFIYTNSQEWCDDAGAGTFRGDSETAAVRWYKETIRKAEPAQDATAQDATAQDATAQDATAQDATAQDAMERAARAALSVNEAENRTCWPTVSGTINGRAVECLAMRNTNGRLGNVYFRWKIDGKRASAAAVAKL